MSELIACAEAAPSVDEVFRVASERLRRIVEFDAAAWLATDPATALPTAPTLIEGLAELDWLRAWELEFQVDDVSLYRELARAAVPAAALRAATGDLPARSARWREILGPSGFGDELRAVMRVGGSPWAALSLLRDHGRPAFEDADVRRVAGISERLAETIREHARPAGPACAGVACRNPGLMLFAPSGEPIAANDEMHAWLDELSPRRAEQDAFRTGLPMIVVGALTRARAIAAGRDRGSARARVRSASGGWLLCHASCLRGPGGEVGETAVAVEAAQSSEVAPIVAQALELSPREREISELIAHGHGTAEIATRLYLSPHTVRDHVKATLSKAGVSSRGELVAKLFA